MVLQLITQLSDSEGAQFLKFKREKGFRTNYQLAKYAILDFIQRDIAPISDSPKLTSSAREIEILGFSKAEGESP